MNSGKGEGGKGGWEPRRIEGGKGTGSGSSKRVGSGREMQNANYCQLLIR